MLLRCFLLKAVLLYGDRRVVVGDVPAPKPPKGWALVRSELAGICGTDKAFYTGSYRLFKSPLVPGHEVVGVVVEGPEGLVGRRVVSEINFPCWSCSYCRAGMYTHCPSKKTLGIDFDGGMAEFFIAPVDALHEFRLEPELGIFVEPLAAVLRALRLKPVKPGDRVAVLGSGNLALLATQVLKNAGVRVDLIARRGSLKAGYFKGLVDSIVYIEEVGESEYDVVFEASGNPEALDLAVKAVKPLGAIHLKSTPGSRASANMTWAVVKEVEVVGSRCGTFREFKEAISMLEKGLVKPRLDRVYGLDDAVNAFEASLEARYFKVAVRP
jgi:alcohol dehydrogenase